MTTVIKDVNKRFDSFQALYNINLEIKAEEFVAILGPSGCGKTTLLRLLAGFDSPTDGTIIMDGKEVANSKKIVPPEERNLGMVFQSFALWPHLNVREHIRFPLQHQQFVPESLRKNMNQRIEEVLKIIDLECFANRMPNALSGGQKQRVALARAIAPKPNLLLMDEPLSNLDAELRMDMRREIQNIHRLTRSTIVYVTHDQNEALAMADRIVVMNKGKIEQIGTPEEIYRMPKTVFVATFVGKANLFEGEWLDDVFIPNNARHLRWVDHGITEELKQKNLYLLRPEQIQIIKAEERGVSGTITSVQFQGKEIHYIILINEISYVVNTPITERFNIGDTVSILPKLEQYSIVKDLIQAGI